MGLSVRRVLESTEVEKGIHLLSVEWDEDAKPGQFAMVECGSSTLLRRPFSIHSASDNKLTILYQVKGAGTNYLKRLKEGDSISVLAPLGNGFEIPQDTSKALLVGGGVGIAPLLFLSETLHTKHVDILTLLGFKDKPFRVEAFRNTGETVVSTESGSYGEKGTIKDLLRAVNIRNFDIIYGCGPRAMLRFLKELTEKEGVRCQISLEERMGCGVGACLSCVCKVRDKGGWHYKRVCKEGPVFWAKDVMI